ncbi:MAG: hypothetical protein KatS3mg027_1257 [Bacteroidia bacterium]|nr:MAG: hypothetical protein KatS3mg027_1257 [Bacteroidia bacterium]
MDFKVKKDSKCLGADDILEPMISIRKFTSSSASDVGVEYFRVYSDGRMWMKSGGSNVAMFTLNDGSNDVVRIFGSGKVVIGKEIKYSTHSDALLQVSGKIVSKEFFVTVQNWSDDVFEIHYKLPDLYELEKYYRTYKTLPGIPNVKEVLNDGVNVGKLIPLLLRKIEELTIIVVNQQKEIDQLKKSNK